MVNKTGRYLFKNVDSAGFDIKTPFQNAVGPLTCKALRDFVAPYRDNDWPSERSRIIDRMLNTTNQTFNSLDLKTYDVILCFDRSSVDRVHNRQCEEAGSAKVVILPGCSGLLFGPSNVHKIVSVIESAITGFISDELSDYFTWMRVLSVEASP